ncbi:MAG: ABC transporter ATP-binding protein [Peptococcaceae bacterium]|nr:ABC transporter ATP-binding protein [Peptococcaceae bacterium]
MLSSVCGLIPFIAMGLALNSVIAGLLTPQLAVILTLVAFLGYLGKAWLYAWSTLCAHKAAYEIIKNIRIATLKKLARMPLGEVQGTRSGAFKQMVIDDAERLEAPLAHAIPEMTASVLTPLLVIGYLIVLDWRLALAALASSVIGNLVYYGMMIGRGKMMPAYMAANSEMNGTIVEYVNGMAVIKAFGRSAASMERLKTSVEKVRQVTTRWYRHCWPFMSAGQAIMPSTLVFMLPAGVALWTADVITLSELILAVLLSLSIVSCLQTVTEFWENLAVIYDIQPRLQAVLDREELPEAAHPDHPRDASVTFQNVRFGYGDAEALHDVSFVAQPGTVTALVGPSGSGKTTVARLLARFWDTQGGAVLVGGVDVRDLSLEELNRQISYVTQENYLLHGTIRDNIRMGRPDATDAEVERAAKLAGCDDFIARLPQGYETQTGDAGNRLSGGERQRISIARALLKDAPIILLDEATSCVDPENEDRLQQAIGQLVKEKTLIVIAHRLSTIAEADQILVMEAGTITAHGSHRELLETSATYRALWRASDEAQSWHIRGEGEASC